MENYVKYGNILLQHRMSIHTHLGYASFATITGDETLAAALREKERTADQSGDAFGAQTNPIVAKSSGKEIWQHGGCLS